MELRLGSLAADSPPPHIQGFGPLGINAYECILMPWHLIALAHLFGGLAQFTD